jgi:hypothetical protein
VIVESAINTEFLLLGIAGHEFDSIAFSIDLAKIFDTISN